MIMKAKRFFFILLFCPIFIFGQTWDYPVKPGTEEWKNLKSGVEKLQSCQIPENVLKKISSLELAKLCVTYPLFYEYTAFNDEREAVSIMIEKFNGLKELSSRKDGAAALIKIYSQMKIQEKEGYVEKGEHSSVLNFEYIELLLSNDKFLNQLSLKEQEELRKLTIEKYGEKLKHIDIYGIDGIKKSLLLSSIIINKIEPNNKNNQQIKDFIKNYNFIDSKELENISKINVQHEK